MRRRSSTDPHRVRVESPRVQRPRGARLPLNRVVPSASWTAEKALLAPHVFQGGSEVANPVVHPTGKANIDRAEDPHGPTSEVEEGAAGVARNAGGERADQVSPAVSSNAQTDSLLRAQLGEADTERGIAVAVDGLEECGTRGIQPYGSTPVRDRGIHATRVRRV